MDTEKIAKLAWIHYRDELKCDVPHVGKWEDLPADHQRAWRVVVAAVQASTLEADLFWGLLLVDDAREGKPSRVGLLLGSKP